MFVLGCLVLAEWKTRLLLSPGYNNKFLFIITSVLLWRRIGPRKKGKKKKENAASDFVGPCCSFSPCSFSPCLWHMYLRLSLIYWSISLSHAGNPPLNTLGSPNTKQIARHGGLPVYTSKSFIVHRSYFFFFLERRQTVVHLSLLLCTSRCCWFFQNKLVWHPLVR